MQRKYEVFETEWLGAKSDQLEEHIISWSRCTRCPLGKMARSHVLWEFLGGLYMADVLMIGEGPGEAENSLGRPFVGPAGRLLRRLIDEVNPDLDICLANLVACRPQDHANAKTNRQPSLEEVQACMPRLIDLLDLLNPSLVVLLGRLPESWWNELQLRTPWQGEVLRLRHPAFLIRVPAGAPEREESALELRNAFRSLESRIVEERARRRAGISGRRK